MTQAASPVLSSSISHLKLNAVQRDAVLHDGGPELVFAGAGTGKTRVLTSKIAHLIEAKKIASNRIFAATFTNKAAREMLTRVEELVGGRCTGLWIGTFHSLCARILRREAGRIGYANTFTIYDTDDQLAVVRAVLKSLQLDDRVMAPRAVLEAISRYKNRCITPAEADATAKGFYEREMVRAYTAYSQMLRQQQAMDFDDLITQTVYLFRAHEDVVQRYRELFDYILVDEYQDTNVSQFLLVQKLVGGRGCVFVVGDDDQSIYGWRGANRDNILSFERAFPGATIFKLEQNYRSTQAILDFAYSAIVPNPDRADKRLWTEAKGGDPVTLTCCRDDRHEAELVSQRITTLIALGVVAGEISVLFRTNAQSRVFEETFRRAKIPYVLVGTTSFYDRKEIKDCMAYLRLLVNPMDDLSFTRIMNVPARGLGDKAFEGLQELAKRDGRSFLQSIMLGDTLTLGTRAQSGVAKLKELFGVLNDSHAKGENPHALLEQVLEFSGYAEMLTQEQTEEAETRLENVGELLSMLKVWVNDNDGKGLVEFLEEVSLVSDLDKWEQRGEAVNLMTLHCAKGLEFRVVFLVGLEDGLLPSRMNLDDEAKVEEERRLFYVGITRARQALECYFALQRMRFGSIVPMSQSRFVETIPPAQYRFVDASVVATPPPRAAQRPQQAGVTPTRVQETKGFDDFSQEVVQFRLGQQVVHPSYGRGRIVSLNGFGNDMRLTVLFQDGARRKLMAAFAGLQTG